MILLHVDVDNLWMYEQEFGIKLHQTPEFIYLHALPLLLKLLRKTHSKATFMIIGKDLELPACQAFCKKALQEGHEIANHTWSHAISFGHLSYKQKYYEITKAHTQITKVCGKAPVGFRGPGYYKDSEVISILHKLKYQYDASILPGLAPVLMKMYAHVKGGKNRYKTFGRFRDTFGSAQPYFVRGTIPNARLLELPISLLPVVKLPIHTTFAYFFGVRYQNRILHYLNSKPQYLLYLFHAIDFVNLPQNSTSPVVALRHSFEERIAFAQKVLKALVSANRGPLKTSEYLLTSIPRLPQLRHR